MLIYSVFRSYLSLHAVRTLSIVIAGKHSSEPDGTIYQNVDDLGASGLLPTACCVLRVAVMSSGSFARQCLK